MLGGYVAYGGPPPPRNPGNQELSEGRERLALVWCGVVVEGVTPGEHICFSSELKTLSEVNSSKHNITTKNHPLGICSDGKDVGDVFVFVKGET